MAEGVIEYAELQRLCRPNPAAPRPRLSTVVKWARDQGIRYRYDGGGGIWTTRAALEQAVNDGDLEVSGVQRPIEELI
jgi:hypothetical protein